MKQLILYLFFCFISGEAVWAIYPPVHNFSRKESNAGKQNWDIVQHPNHWMYFANNNGLLEFDGYHWKTYPIANYTNVRSLYYDAEEDRIYAGAFNEFGYYARNDQGLLKYKSLVNLLDVSDRNFNEIWHIHKNHGELFFQSDWSVFRLKGDSIKKLRFPHKIEYSEVIYGILLVSTIEEGILTLNGDLFIPLPGGQLLQGKKVCAMLPFGDSDILFVTALNGMYLYNGVEVRSYQTDMDYFLHQNQVFCADIKGSKLALGTVQEGVVIKDLEKNENTYSNTYSGLQNNTVLSLAFDQQDNLWLGLDKGIDYVMIHSPVYNLFGDSRLYGTGYCSLVKDRRLYLGTNQGLYVTSFPVEPYPKPSTMQLFDRILGQVWSLQEIDGVLFCATDRGLFTIRGNTAERIPQVDGTWKLIELKSHPGYLLGSSYRGFFLLKKEKGRWRYSHTVRDFEDSGGMFEEDSFGNIWFCHWMKGIFKLTFDSEQLDHFAVEIINTQKGLYVNQNNVLVKMDNEIVISSDGGFFQYNYASERMEHAQKYEQIFGIHSRSMRMTQLSSGDIWCISAPYFALGIQQPDGSYVVDTSSFNYLKNKLVMGFEDFNLIDYNTILVSTEDGFSWLDMEKARLAKHPDTFFQVMIKNVFITNEKDSLVAGFQLTPRKINEFKYKHNSIRFEFIAPEYRDEKAITYSYMLENYDADWSAYSQTNVKEYTKLPKGVYTFKVRAKNFLESETAETSYTFTILPPWYESPAFMFIYILLAIGSLFLLVLYVKRKSEEGAREMEIRKEQEMKEQEKIFTASTKEKEKEIVALKNQKLQYELRHKSQELANSTMNLIRKNEMLQDLNTGIDKIYHAIGKDDTSKTTLMIRKQLQIMQQEIKQNIERDDNWKKFEENFDMIYENYLKRLKMQHPELSKNDLKLCAYLKMGLSSKDIAPLLNLSFRSIEMCRYRLRKKINLDRDTNLTTYLQNF